MKEKYLLVNAGSSSLKFALYNMPEKEEILNGNVERIGDKEGFYTISYNGDKVKVFCSVQNHVEALNIILNELQKRNFITSLEEISTVVHRVAHGGNYSSAVLVNDDVINYLESISELAVLHVPAEVNCVKAAQEIMPQANHVTVFDTAFHQTIPEENSTYAVPLSWKEKYGVKKYGFHGTSCKYITEKFKEIMRIDNPNLIICHIGSGASVTCVKDGKSFDTSMGMTPLDGVVMSTRCGNIDATVVDYMSKKLNISSADVKNGDRKAVLAKKIFEKSIIKYIAQYYFELEGNVDAIIFTAGIGENMPGFREDIINAISPITGVEIETDFNKSIAKNGSSSWGAISTMSSRFPVFVIPTNEEEQMVCDAEKIVNEKNNAIGLKKIWNNLK